VDRAELVDFFFVAVAYAITDIFRPDGANGSWAGAG